MQKEALLNKAVKNAHANQTMRQAPVRLLLDQLCGQGQHGPPIERRATDFTRIGKRDGNYDESLTNHRGRDLAHLLYLSIQPTIPEAVYMSTSIL